MGWKDSEEEVDTRGMRSENPFPGSVTLDCAAHSVWGWLTESHACGGKYDDTH